MTGDQTNRLSREEAWKLSSEPQLKTEELKMGPLTSYSLLNDPKHMCFVLARYKFCAKMLEGTKYILEIGCGDGFGTPIVAQNVEYLLAIDSEDVLIESNRRRLKKLKNIEFRNIDICNMAPDGVFDGVFSIDVIEHIEPHLEKSFMENSCKCLKDNGICIVGTPNITASKYATERSRILHINLKSHKALRDLMSEYFENVLMFSMNDEVVHTGYPAMAHYLLAVGVGKRREAK